MKVLATICLCLMVLGTMWIVDFNDAIYLRSTDGDWVKHHDVVCSRVNLNGFLLTLTIHPGWARNSRVQLHTYGGYNRPRLVLNVNRHNIKMFYRIGDL
jgi:hypothetical protein